MDKTLRRAKATRFSSPNKEFTKQSGRDFKNLRRDKVRRLNFVERHCSKTIDCEMGSIQSDGDDEFRGSKRFKLPQKFLNDCPRVDHATVPRKLRSAMRKRCRESVSPQFREGKKLNHTANALELVKRDGMKKPRLKQTEEYDGSARLTSVVPISKDEEEVAETLYALAGMFSDSDKTEKPTSTVQEEEDLQTTSTTSTPEAARESSNKVYPADETVGIQYLDQGTEFDLHGYKQLPTELCSYIPKSDGTKVSIFSKSSPASGSLSTNSTFPNHSKLRRGPRLKEPTHNLSLTNEKNKDIAVESVATFRRQSELHPIIEENKHSGLSSTRVHGRKMPGSPVKFSATKLPTWLGVSSDNARFCSSGNVSLAKKVPRSHSDAKSTWKKCSTHVHISRLINVLKDTEAKENLPLLPTQLAAHEGSNHGLSDNPSKTTDAVLLHKGLLEDQQQASLNSWSYTTQKQSFNFLSLSAGSCGVEENRFTGGQGNGNQPEPSTQSHVSYMRPFTQSQTSMPVSLSRNHHISTFVDSAAAGGAQMAQIQQPPYMGNSTTSQLSLTDYQKQQLQQQQWLWAAQLIAPYKPEEFAAAAARPPHWKNSRQESPCIMQYVQPLHPVSLDVLGPRYIPVSPEQQQQKGLISSKSLSHQRYNHHQLPASHEGGVFRADNTLSMKLLYSEHL